MKAHVHLACLATAGLLASCNSSCNYTSSSSSAFSFNGSGTTNSSSSSWSSQGGVTRTRKVVEHNGVAKNEFTRKAPDYSYTVLSTGPLELEQRFVTRLNSGQKVEVKCLENGKEYRFVVCREHQVITAKNEVDGTALSPADENLLKKVLADVQSNGK